MVMTAVITIIAAYLIGSINFAVIFSTVFFKKDVRNFGSGNAGTTNMLRVGGFVPGLLTFACDVLKGFSAAILGRYVFDYIHTQTGSSWSLATYGALACGLACMIGHMFPVFFNFKGGKGVASCVGIFYVCCPIAITVGLAVFALMILISRIVSISSLSATIVVVALSLFLYDKGALFWPQAVFTIAMGAGVYLKHSENIKRLIAGDERKISIGRRK